MHLVLVCWLAHRWEIRSEKFKVVPAIFNWGQDRRAENQGRRPRVRLGPAYWGQQAPSPSARDRALWAPKGFPPFSAFKMASPDTIILSTIMQPLGEWPRAPPLAYALETIPCW